MALGAQRVEPLGLSGLVVVAQIFFWQFSRVRVFSLHIGGDHARCGVDWCKGKAVSLVALTVVLLGVLGCHCWIASKPRAVTAHVVRGEILVLTGASVEDMRLPIGVGHAVAKPVLEVIVVGDAAAIGFVDVGAFNW